MGKGCGEERREAVCQDRKHGRESWRSCEFSKLWGFFCVPLATHPNDPLGQIKHKLTGKISWRLLMIRSAKLSPSVWYLGFYGKFFVWRKNIFQQKRKKKIEATGAENHSSRVKVDGANCGGRRPLTTRWGTLNLRESFDKRDRVWQKNEICW